MVSGEHIFFTRIIRFAGAISLLSAMIFYVWQTVTGNYGGDRPEWRWFVFLGWVGGVTALAVGLTNRFDPDYFRAAFAALLWAGLIISMFHIVVDSAHLLLKRGAAPATRQRATRSLTTAAILSACGIVVVVVSVLLLNPPRQDLVMVAAGTMLVTMAGYKGVQGMGRPPQTTPSNHQEPTTDDLEKWEFPAAANGETDNGNATETDEKGSSHFINAWSVSLIGIISGTVVGSQGFPPAVSIGSASLVAGSVFVFGRKSRKRCALAGTIFALGLGTVYRFWGGVPEGYAASPAICLLMFGSVSALIVGLRGLLRRGIISLTERSGSSEHAGLVWDAISALLGLLAMIYTVLTVKEKAARYGGVSVGGSAGFVLNVLGIELPLPVVIQDGLDATMVMFVGAVLIGWHTLATIHSWKRAFWLLIKYNPMLLSLWFHYRLFLRGREHYRENLS